MALKVPSRRFVANHVGPRWRLITGGNVYLDTHSALPPQRPLRQSLFWSAVVIAVAAFAAIILWTVTSWLRPAASRRLGLSRNWAPVSSSATATGKRSGLAQCEF
jgi:hypothetical protein